MPIKVDLHNNTSQVKVRPKSPDQVNVESNCNVDKKRFEALLDEETRNRILGDERLERLIDQKPSQFDLIYTKENNELKLDAFDKYGRLVATTSTTIEIPDAANFIVIEQPHGIFSEDLLNYLIANKLNKLVYLNYIYSLVYTDEDYWIYAVGSTTDPGIIYTIVVNINTGEYTYSEIEEEYVIVEDDSEDSDDENCILTFLK